MKRATFYGMRGKKAAFNGMRGKREETTKIQQRNSVAHVQVFQRP
jgi:hypothetical protein